MTSAQQVRSVLFEEYRDLIVEDQEDGGAVVRDLSVPPSLRDDPPVFLVSDVLYRCADLLADSGFVIALVRDEDGVHLNAY
jgi:hypothetical protein